MNPFNHLSPTIRENREAFMLCHGRVRTLCDYHRLSRPQCDIAAKWHGYYEYLHPFRDGNGRTGRLLSDFLLLRAGHPFLIIKLEDRSEYVSALKQIRTEGTDERLRVGELCSGMHLVAFFFKTAIDRMKSELAQKRKNTLPTMFF